MGATHLVAIGTSCPRTEGSKNAEKIKPSLGFVAGAVLNSIFLDSLEPDFTLLKRFNELASPNSAIKKISVALFQPSQDPGRIAKDFFHELPFNFRQLMKAAAISPDEAGDLISYLMFTKGYISALIQLGEKDAANQLRLNQSLFDTK